MGEHSSADHHGGNQGLCFGQACTSHLSGLEKGAETEHFREMRTSSRLAKSASYPMNNETESQIVRPTM